MPFVANVCEVIPTLSYIRNRSLFKVVDNNHIFHKTDKPIIHCTLH